MRVPTTRRGTTPHRPAVGARLVGAGLVATSVLCLITLAGCGAAQGSGSPSPVASRSASSPIGPATSVAPVVPRVPGDGVTLGTLGFTYGPLDSFSLPRALVISTRVDQPNAVTVVMTVPSLSGLADYLRRALPATGYAITAQDPTGTMTFAGHGWTGSVTGDDRVAAVTLSPLP